MTRPPTLRSERLTLRALTPEDLGAVHRIFDDPAVRRHLFDNRPVSLQTTQNILQQSARDFAAAGIGLFGIKERGREALIGFCGFFVVEGVGEPELTYGLLPAYWGRGYATEAAREVARYALEAAGFRRVLVATEEANSGSMRVIERLGARPLGRAFPAHPEAVYFELGGPALPAGEPERREERGGRSRNKRTRSGT